MADARVVLLPGDGVGPEVVEQARLALALLAPGVEVEERLIGAVAIRATGDPLPAETLAACRAATAVLKGPVGDPEFDAADVLVMCAAVADFRPATAAPGKIAKGSAEHLALELEATEDVLAALSARRRDGQTLVGFAAEHGDGALERAREKLVHKRLDAIVCNDVSAPGIGFDSERNAVTIITPDREEHVGPAEKRVIAEAVLDAIEALRG